MRGQKDFAAAGIHRANLGSRTQLSVCSIRKTSASEIIQLRTTSNRSRQRACRHSLGLVAQIDRLQCRVDTLAPCPAARPSFFDLVIDALGVA